MPILYEICIPNFNPAHGCQFSVKSVSLILVLHMVANSLGNLNMQIYHTKAKCVNVAMAFLIANVFYSACLIIAESPWGAKNLGTTILYSTNFDTHYVKETNIIRKTSIRFELLSYFIFNIILELFYYLIAIFHLFDCCMKQALFFRYNIWSFGKR